MASLWYCMTRCDGGGLKKIKSHLKSLLGTFQSTMLEWHISRKMNTPHLRRWGEKHPDEIWTGGERFLLKSSCKTCACLCSARKGADKFGWWCSQETVLNLFCERSKFCSAPDLFWEKPERVMKSDITFFFIFEKGPVMRKVQGHISFPALPCTHTHAHPLLPPTHKHKHRRAILQSPQLDCSFNIYSKLNILWQKVDGGVFLFFVCFEQLLWEAESRVAEGATWACHPRIPCCRCSSSTAASGVQEAGRPADGHLQTAASTYEGKCAAAAPKLCI